MKKALFLFILGLFSTSLVLAQPTRRTTTTFKKPQTAKPPVPSPVNQTPIGTVSSGKSYNVAISKSEALTVNVGFKRPTLVFLYSPSIETLGITDNMLEFRVFETQTTPSNSAMTAEKCSFNEVNINNFKAYLVRNQPVLTVDGRGIIYTWTFLIMGLKKGTEYSVEVLNNQIKPMEGYTIIKKGMVGELIPSCNRSTVGGNGLDVLFDPIRQ